MTTLFSWNFWLIFLYYFCEEISEENSFDMLIDESFEKDNHMNKKENEKIQHNADENKTSNNIFLSFLVRTK